jgi:hypothetical protein
MDDNIYENLKYIRSSLRGQLRGKPYHSNCPLRAHWQSPGLAVIENVETGDVWYGDGSSGDIRWAIIDLLYDQIPQAVRLREYLKAAAEALNAKPGAKEVYSPFQQRIWEDLIDRPKYSPALVVQGSDEGPILRVRMNGYVWGDFHIDKALQHPETDSIRWELSRLYFKGSQMIEAYEDDECPWRDVCEGLGAVYEPPQEEA